MVISIASGKGGTGKTTVATSLALSLGNNVQFLDCDVEEPNSHIFLKPHIKQKHYVTIAVPEVDEKKCTFCGKCQEVCAYNAIAVIKNTVDKGSVGKVLVFNELCHGCGGCSLLCPEGAIIEKGKEIGVLETGVSNLLGRDIKYIGGRLNIGVAISPPLIRAVKKNIDHDSITIIDSPPGTSCPVIESIKKSDYCILVTEPTPFGLNDLVLAVGVLRKMEMPFGVVINRADIGNDETAKYCAKENIEILMEIPFKREIAEAYSRGISIVEAIPHYKKGFEELFKNIQ